MGINGDQEREGDGEGQAALHVSLMRLNLPESRNSHDFKPLTLGSYSNQGKRTQTLGMERPILLWRDKQ